MTTYRDNPANREREANLRKEVSKELPRMKDGETKTVYADNPRGRGDSMTFTKRNEGYEIDRWGTKKKE